MHSLAGRGQGPFVGQVGGQHESAEDEEHTVGTLCQNPHHLGVDVRNLEEGKLDQDEGTDGSGEVSIGPANKGGTDVHGSGGHDVRVLVALKHVCGGKGSVVAENIILVDRERKKSGGVQQKNSPRQLIFVFSRRAAFVGYCAIRNGWGNESGRVKRGAG